MNVLLKNVTIISASSPHHLKAKDILITDGIIRRIADNIAAEDYRVISGENLHASVGWMDIFADFGEPGNEYRETLVTGANAAAAGGFTDVMLMPDTHPPVSSKSSVEYFKQRSRDLPVNIHPIGTITKNGEGTALAEMYDMLEGGAIAFSDGRTAVQQPGIFLKGLQYLSAKNAVAIQIPDDKNLSSGGMMSEGVVSTTLGLLGIPAIAEELMIARDLALLEYTDARLHITGVSTSKSLSLINEAKAKGLQVTCSVTPYHIFFCDEDLGNYDTNLKVNPPLRTRNDMEALQAALRNGDVDCIASHHNPQCSDDKNCEFELANDGMITLQNVFAAGNGKGIELPDLVKILSENPRNIFDVAHPKLEEGAPACITIFDPSAEITFEEKMILSKSKNSPFIGKKLKGKVIGTINRGRVTLHA